MHERILNEIEAKIRIYPGYADLTNQMGILLMKGGDLKDAKRHFLKALQLNPDYQEARLNLGFLYIGERRWKEVEEVFLSESGRNRKNGFLQHVLGLCYLRIAKRQEAEVQIRKAIRLCPSYREFYPKRGAWRKGAGHLSQEAEKALDRIRTDYQETHFRNFVGLYLAQQGKFSQAIRELRRATGIQPDQALFHSNLGTVHYPR